MRVLLLVLTCTAAFTANAQRQMRPLYDLDDRGMKNSGWHFSPGITYMFPSEMNSTSLTENVDITEEVSASGRVGLYAELGRHHLLRNLYFLDHLDYGIAYKKLSGRERTEIICETCDAVTTEGIYKDNFASAYVNFSNIWQISDYNFIQNGFGVNGDYRFLLNQTVEPLDIGAPHLSPDPLQVQLHYKLSFGMKAEKGVFILPSIEVPILNVIPFGDGRSTLKYFDSGYRPIIFSIKFMFLSKRKPEDCKGSTDGRTGHKLWDKKMKR
ncbi:MAG: hypothetical protein AB8B53_05340 [Flavobacteriales bacterium]